MGEAEGGVEDKECGGDAWVAHLERFLLHISWGRSVVKESKQTKVVGIEGMWSALARGTSNSSFDKPQDRGVRRQDSPHHVTRSPDSINNSQDPLKC